MSYSTLLVCGGLFRVNLERMDRVFSNIEETLFNYATGSINLILYIISSFLLITLIVFVIYKNFNTKINKIRSELERLKKYEVVEFPRTKKGSLGLMMSEVESLSVLLAEEKERARRHEQHNLLSAKIDKEMNIPNRSYFMELLEKEQQDNNGALLISIKFSNLIKHFAIKGTDLSNRILSDSLTRVLEHSMDGSFIGRMSTSHFMLYIPATHDLIETEIVDLVLNIQKDIDIVHKLEDTEHYLHASFGIAYSNSKRTSTLINLIHLAELAVIEKSNMIGKNIYMSHSALQIEEEEKYQMETALHKSFNKKEFKVVYQPIISLTDSSVSLETLVRWKYKSEWISPVLFIPIIEELGLIEKLTCMVVDMIIDDYDFWKKTYSNLAYISLNISPEMLKVKDSLFLSYINNKTKLKGIQHQSICFEITENVVLNENTLCFINESRRQGYLIAIDDFGTGYSSMAYIANYSFNILKVDRAFVKQLEENSKQREVALAIIQLAKRLNIQVVAEGVETEGQLDILIDMGTDAIQGYYYSKPQFVDEWTPFELTADKKVIPV